MTKKNVRDYFVEKPKATKTLVQTKIDASLAVAVRKQMKRDRVNLKELLEASFKRYLDESDAA